MLKNQSFNYHSPFLLCGHSFSLAHESSLRWLGDDPLNDVARHLFQQLKLAKHRILVKNRPFFGDLAMAELDVILDTLGKEGADTERGGAIHRIGGPIASAIAEFADVQTQSY